MTPAICLACCDGGVLMIGNGYFEILPDDKQKASSRAEEMIIADGGIDGDDSVRTCAAFQLLP